MRDRNALAAWTREHAVPVVQDDRSTRRANVNLVLAVLLSVLIGMIAYHLGVRSASSDEDPFDRSERASESAITAFITRHGPALSSYIDAIHHHQVATIPGQVGYVLPPLVDTTMHIVLVTTDANGNLYFTTESTIFAEYGFARRCDQQAFLGDGLSPRITYLKALSEPWYVFLAQ